MDTHGSRCILLDPILYIPPSQISNSTPCLKMRLANVLLAPDPGIPILPLVSTLLAFSSNQLPHLLHQLPFYQFCL
jgi:hypothetical protein